MTQQDERMLTERRNPCVAQADPALIAAFRNASTPLISDNLGRLAGAVDLRPFHRRGRLAGTALTVRTRTGDNLAVHEALGMIRPGDVVVVDAGGDTSRAVVGEIMKAIAEHNGAAGFVIDGAIRDAACFAASDFPCFARAAVHKGPYKNGPGDINVPVSIGGCVIAPGDIVVGDEDGVVVVSAQHAEKVAAIAQEISEQEALIIEAARAGNSLREARIRFGYHQLQRRLDT
jgi:RraA family protein